MNSYSLLDKVQKIVRESQKLKDRHTDQVNAQVNYVCIFSHTFEEYNDLYKLITKFGEIVQDTTTGPLIKFPPMPTTAGDLQLLKIRMPDVSRKERGDADFTVKNYQEFKNKYINNSGFKLIIRDKFEMIELSDSSFGVLAYFSNPPLDVQLGL
jgi:hypothetical protein